MKKLIFAGILLAFLVSCQNNNTTTDQSVSQTSVQEDPVMVQLNEFDEQAGNLVGKQVTLSGTIDHVCKHGGQKMFMVHRDSDARVKITTGEDMAAFNTELEGENLMVVGIVDELRIDEDYLREWEEELKADQKSEAGEKVHMGEGEGEADHHEESDHSQEYDQIKAYRDMIKASGKDYVSFFSVTCLKYDIVEQGV